jgi:hypothetical protein
LGEPRIEDTAIAAFLKRRETDANRPFLAFLKHRTGFGNAFCPAGAVAELAELKRGVYD